MANLSQVIWTIVVTIIVSAVRVPALEDNDFKFTLSEEDKFPSANFVPVKLRMSDEVYDRLLVHLGDQLSSENVDIAVNDYFPKEIETDEEDDLEFVHGYDLDEDEADDIDEFISDFPNDASISTGFGKREFKFTKMLSIRKNGTKTFSKIRQSSKVVGNATTSATGNFNTSLDTTTSASGKFDVNTTYFSKGQHKTVVASGAVVASSLTESQVKERKIFQQANSEAYSTLQIPAPVNVNSSVRSGSETVKLPLRSFLTLFKTHANATANNVFKINSILAGQVVSRVAYANKTVSLTKSCIKAYAKSKISDNKSTNDDEDDNEDVASPNVFQISLMRGKTHTWTKVVSQSKTQMVVDVITCTKTRIYGKSFKRGEFVIFSGSGQVSWEKSQITIDAKRLHNLSPHEYGVHFIKNQLESTPLISIQEIPFEL